MASEIISLLDSDEDKSVKPHRNFPIGRVLTSAEKREARLLADAKLSKGKAVSKGVIDMTADDAPQPLDVPPAAETFLITTLIDNVNKGLSDCEKGISKYELKRDTALENGKKDKVKESNEKISEKLRINLFFEIMKEKLLLLAKNNVVFLTKADKEQMEKTCQTLTNIERRRLNEAAEKEKTQAEKEKKHAEIRAEKEKKQAEKAEAAKERARAAEIAKAEAKAEEKRLKKKTRGYDPRDEFVVEDHSSEDFESSEEIKSSKENEFSEVLPKVYRNKPNLRYLQIDYNGVPIVRIKKQRVPLVMPSALILSKKEKIALQKNHGDKPKHDVRCVATLQKVIGPLEEYINGVLNANYKSSVDKIMDETDNMMAKYKEVKSTFENEIQAVDFNESERHLKNIPFGAFYSNVEDVEINNGAEKGGANYYNIIIERPVSSDLDLDGEAEVSGDDGDDEPDDEDDDDDDDDEEEFDDDEMGEEGQEMEDEEEAGKLESFSYFVKKRKK